MTRAMILAAGLGTRMRPLSNLRAKPALPVRGLPVIGYLLELLARNGVTEVIVNTHHLAESVEHAVESFCPRGVRVRFSHEESPLGTGGGIRRAAEFLLESDPCLVLAGDMLLDLDLRELVSRHQERRDLATLVLRNDSRAGRFGSIGIGEGGAVRRIAESLDLGHETAAGVFVGVRVLAREFLETIPQQDCFEDLRDWMMPALADGCERIRAELYSPAQCGWEPVGTPEEYLSANLRPLPPAYANLTSTAREQGARFGDGLVIGAGARVPSDAKLTRCVVWDGEEVPADAVHSDGAYAGGRFIPCLPQAGPGEQNHSGSSRD